MLKNKDLRNELEKKNAIMNIPQTQIRFPGSLRIKLVKLDLDNFKIVHNKVIESPNNDWKGAVRGSQTPDPFCAINIIELGEETSALHQLELIVLSNYETGNNIEINF